MKGIQPEGVDLGQPAQQGQNAGELDRDPMMGHSVLCYRCGYPGCSWCTSNSFSPARIALARQRQKHPSWYTNPDAVPLWLLERLARCSDGVLRTTVDNLLALARSSEAGLAARLRRAKSADDRWLARWISQHPDINPDEIDEVQAQALELPEPALVNRLPYAPLLGREDHDDLLEVDMDPEVAACLAGFPTPLIQSPGAV